MENKDKFVTKKPYERKADYLRRCIPKLVSQEGYGRAQAAAICNSDFDRQSR